MIRIVLLCSAVLVTACSRPSPNAGVVTAENAGDVLFFGPVAEGSVGDFYLQNDHLTAIIQKPGRVFGPAPYGGNVIDIGPTATRVDYVGETLAFFQLGLTPDFDTIRVVSDGSDRGPAVIEASGTAEIWDFVTLESLLPGLLPFDPTEPVPIRVRAFYTLGRDAEHLEVRYLVENPTEEDLSMHVGFALDVRGGVDAFSPGRGFSDPGVDIDDIGALLGEAIDSPFLAYQGDDHALGVKSRDFLDGEETPRVSVGIVGVAVFLLGAEGLAALIDDERAFTLPAKTERGFGFDLFVGRDVGDVAAWALGTPDWGELRGRVVERGSGAPVGDARVAVIDPDDGDVIDSFVSDADGRWGGAVPPGDYHVAADDLGRAPDPGQRVTVSEAQPTDVTITLAPSAVVNVQVKIADDLTGPETTTGPCRVVLLGVPPDRSGGVCGVSINCKDNSPFRHQKRWELGGVERYVAYLTTCDTLAGGDAPLEVIPGRYLAVVSRGAAFDTVTRLVEATPSAPLSIAGTLHRVVDASDYAASVFHVHQVRSTDSIVDLETRAKSFAAAGIDFFATTDHDAVTDLRPVLEALALDDVVWGVPGVEVSTMDLGHFNGFPIEPGPGAWGEPPDWGGGRDRPSPGELFQRIRDRGARVVQCNHPRTSTAYFSSIGLSYDLASGVAAANPDFAPDPASMMMTPGVELFSPTFDAIEIFNSTRSHKEVMRDWFNFLSMGFLPTATATSDTHSFFLQGPDEPFTYVAAPGGRGRGIDVDRLLDNLAAGRAIATSGPFLTVTAEAEGRRATFGELLSPAAGDVTVTITAETATWTRLTTAEIFYTEHYDDPVADAEYGDPAPSLTVPLEMSGLERDNGGRAWRYAAEVTLDDAFLGTADGWLVVWVRGPGYHQYPVSLDGGGATIFPSATTPESFAAFHGRAPFAMGNPVFFDRDGNGVYDPPFPMR